MKYLVLLSMLLMSCSDSSTPALPPVSECGANPVDTYTVTWDPVVDADLSGYIVHYKLFDSNKLTKTNGTKTNIITDESWPMALSFLKCDVVEVGVVALGFTKSQSPLSLTALITIN